LPRAEVHLWRRWLADEQAQCLFERLLATLDWQQPTLIIAGQEHPIPRLQAWHGDADALYTYSGKQFVPAPWTAELMEIRERLERACDSRFNSVLVNCYRTGADGMGFHADKEPELGPEPVIASLSLGATRRFILKPARRDRKSTRHSLRPAQNSSESLALELHSGDLLLMRGTTQRHWRHGIPKTRRAVGARINLTFRWVNAS
jgi:alkylated DNA repair dioxygenase AlkB